MTPTDLLSHLRQKTPEIPLKISEYETINNWQVYIDNLEETLALESKKKCYITALEFAEKVMKVLDEKEDAGN